MKDQRTRLECLLEPVLADARVSVAEITAEFAWNPRIFEQGEADPQFRVEECFVLSIGHSVLTVPSTSNSDADLQVFLAGAVQDAVIDSIWRAWPSVDQRVLNPRVELGGAPVWSDNSGRLQFRLGTLALHGIDP